MSEFWIFFEKGFRHILNLSAYDPILFLIALTIPYTFKDWKRVLLLVTIFTVGHTVALLLSIFEAVIIKINLVGFFIPISVLIIAFYTIFTAGKSSKQQGISVIGFVNLFIGIIHGLSFANFFKTLTEAPLQSKLLALSEYALGIETAQIVVVFMVLLLSYIVQTFFRFSKRDWTLVMSAFVIGVVLQMIISNEIWKI
jgi:hypothetical protein